MTRASGGSCTSRATAATEIAKDSTTTPHATVPDAFLLSRRAKLALMRKPTSGRRGIRSSMLLFPSKTSLRDVRRIASVTLCLCDPLPLQARKRIRVQRLAMAEQADHDREADGGLGRGNRHHEEHDDLSVGTAERSAERDETEVDGVQHDLDRQQDGDQVPADEHARRADGKENRRQNEVVVECRHDHIGGADAPPLWESLFASTTAPTIAAMISNEVTSNANA